MKTNVIDKNPQYSSEVVFVDDGSTDKSFQILHNLYKAYPELIVIVKLTRNFGTYPAIIAGYEKARGSCLINISADMQDPPELINDMLNFHFNENYNIVICHRESRDESTLTDQLLRKYFMAQLKNIVSQICPKEGLILF